MIKTSQFLKTFRVNDEPLHVRAFRPKKAPPAPDNEALTWSTTVAELISSRDLQKELISANATRGIYFAPNVGGSNDESITRYTAFFAEDDSRSIAEQHARLDASNLLPSIRVETLSSVHAYWSIAGECGEAEWRDVQGRLISYFDCDSQIKNPSRVMRLPGFNHLHVNGDGLELKKITIHTFEPERRYTIAQMLEAFPAPVAAPEPENVPHKDTKPSNGPFETWEQLNVEAGARISNLPGAHAERKGWTHAPGVCHGSTDGKALFVAPDGAYGCHNKCAGDVIRAALGLPQHPVGESGSKGSVREPLPDDPDDTTIARLAKLSQLAYERVRESEAQAIGCRTSILDKLVAAARPKEKGNDLQGRELEFADVELWPVAVDGAEVLNEVSEIFARYLALPPGAADILAAWCAHTHVYDAFICSPRLNITSPEKGCGKTLLRDVVHQFVPRPLSTENMTVAVLFRLIESRQPTILADEYDAWIYANDELRGCMNSGYRRGGQSHRCEGDNNEVRGFNVFAPVVLCGIGALPGTLNDRSIKVSLARARRGEVRERFDSRRTKREQELCRKLARWCADNRPLIESCDPALPESAFNRVADNWRPLFSIARVAGGDWPQRITSAFTKQTAEADDEGIGIMLLADIQRIFTEKNAERLFSRELVDALCEMTDRPWPEVRRDKPISESWLASRLRPFGILPNTLRVEAGRAKGYELNRFTEAFGRYLPDPPLSSRDTVTTRINIDENDISGRDKDIPCHGLKTQERPVNIDLSRCHDLKAPTAAIETDEAHEERRRRYEPVFASPARRAAWDSWEEGTA